ncbi:tubulin-specific chaperone A [Syncephalis fuscata]|nr:tubulin-specific chaperone A [Syncephalis fuscata]
MAERSLKINTGALKRITKEHKYYIAEAEKQSAKIEQMLVDNADPYDVKKQREVLDDTLQMIPDALRRIEEMRAKVTQLISDPDIVDEAVKIAAQEAIAESNE